MRRLVCEEIRTSFQQIFVVGINFTVVPRSMLCGFPISSDSQDMETAEHAEASTMREIAQHEVAGWYHDAHQ